MSVLTDMNIYAIMPTLTGREQFQVALPPYFPLMRNTKSTAALPANHPTFLEGSTPLLCRRPSLTPPFHGAVKEQKYTRTGLGVVQPDSTLKNRHTYNRSVLFAIPAYG